MLKQNYEQYKVQQNILNPLKAIDTLGSFDYTTLIIELNSLTSNDLSVLSKQKLMNQPQINADLRRVLSLAIHEYTHFIDATSTLWGIKHLSLMTNAYLSNYALGGKEDNFYLAKNFYDHVRKVKYPKYYTVVNNGDDQQPWTARPTLGRTFDSSGNLTDESILFMRFRTNFNPELVRNPISIVSLFETSAMYQELAVKMVILKQIKELPEYYVESKTFEDELLKFIYDKNLTEYSSCVHMLANAQQCSDIMLAFSLASFIIRVVLNCTNAIFSQIIEKNSFASMFNSTENAYIKQGLIHRNLGVLYYLIVMHLPTESYLNPKQGLLESLKKLEIPIEDVLSSAKQEFKEIYSNILADQYPSLQRILEASKDNFEKIDILSPNLSFEKLHLPRVILNEIDSEGNIAEAFIFNNPQNIFSDLTCDTIHEELYTGYEWVSRFSEGCI